MFQSPMTLLKNSSSKKLAGPEDEDSCQAPTFEDTKERIQNEMRHRESLKNKNDDEINRIPQGDTTYTQATDKIKTIIGQSFSQIRCQVSDQIQLYSESFFLLPMLRRLEGDMSQMQLSDEDSRRYRTRKKVLDEEGTKAKTMLTDLEWS